VKTRPATTSSASLRMTYSRIKPFAVGIATYVPGICSFLSRTGGTDNARYCYSVWLRHLVAANQHGVISGVPESVAEIGPGDSIGSGLAALLSGVRSYSALDAVPLASPANNTAVFDQLVELFAARSDIPDDAEFPLVSPRLRSYQFPRDLVTEEVLRRSMAPARIGVIRDAIAMAQPCHAGAEDVALAYIITPWTRPDIFSPGSFDMIYSQAVLEHVDEPEKLYRAMYVWLKPGGCMSHDIDLSHHGIGPLSNSHWSYSDRAWRIIRGRRSWLLNRWPRSWHISTMKKSGFRLVVEIPSRSGSTIKRSSLAERYWAMSDEDLVTAGSYILAVKPVA
jgi:SAM-dependent methyltransferase